jgi:hypothetical protein
MGVGLNGNRLPILVYLRREHTRAILLLNHSQPNGIWPRFFSEPKMELLRDQRNSRQA